MGEHAILEGGEEVRKKEAVLQKMIFYCFFSNKCIQNCQQREMEVGGGGGGGGRRSLLIPSGLNPSLLFYQARAFHIRLRTKLQAGYKFSAEINTKFYHARLSSIS